LTVLQWFGEFFATLPEALHALWLFGDPEGRGRGWFGIFVLVLWAVPLTAVPLYIAKITYGKREWVSATMGVMGATSILWWVFGVIPSGWMFFTSAEVDVLEHAIIPSSATIEVREGYVIEIATDLYNVIADSVTAGLMIGGIVLCLWLALRVQKSLPKQLDPDETKPEAGGYR
jgi:hypothetical protein